MDTDMDTLPEPDSVIHQLAHTLAGSPSRWMPTETEYAALVRRARELTPDGGSDVRPDRNQDF